MKHHLLDVALTNRDLDRLYLPSIRMTVPTLEGALTTHAKREETDGIAQLIAEVHEPEKSISLYREDETLLQVRNMDRILSVGAQQGLTRAIHHLNLINDHGIWIADLEPDLINDRLTMIDFISTAAHVAAIKQDNGNFT